MSKYGRFGRTHGSRVVSSPGSKIASPSRILAYYKKNNMTDDYIDMMRQSIRPTITSESIVNSTP